MERSIKILWISFFSKTKLRQPTGQKFFPTFPKEISHFLQTYGSHSYVRHEMQKKSGIMKSGLDAMPLFLLDNLIRHMKLVTHSKRNLDSHTLQFIQHQSMFCVFFQIWKSFSNFRAWLWNPGSIKLLEIVIGTKRWIQYWVPKCAPRYDFFGLEQPPQHWRSKMPMLSHKTFATNLFCVGCMVSQPNCL